jgi:hypothetical protein
VDGVVTDGTSGTDTFEISDISAWNNFAYSYKIPEYGLMRAAADPVGVLMPSYPAIVKSVVNADGQAESLGVGQEFQFVVYSGNAVKAAQASMKPAELLGVLEAAGRQATFVSVTVPAGKSQAWVILQGVPAWELADGVAQASDDEFSWVNDERYTVMELIDDESEAGGAGDAESAGASSADGAGNAGSGFTYKSINGNGKASYTFGYNNAVENELLVQNEIKSWEINVLKTGDDHGQWLEGAWFALYEPAGADVADGTLSDAEVSALGADALATAPARTVEADGQRWQIAAVAKTDAAGCINWSGLMGQQYYVLELQAPNGYVIGSAGGADGDSGEGVTGDESTSDGTSSGAGASDTFANAGTIVASGSGQVVSQSSAVGGSCTLEVVNYLTYTLPNSGGPGVWPFVAAGLALIACALTLALFRRQCRLG